MCYYRCLTFLWAFVTVLFMHTATQSIDEIKFIGLDGPAQFWKFEVSTVTTLSLSLD